jgi:hypothetical protein
MRPLARVLARVLAQVRSEQERMQLELWKAPAPR